MATTEPIRDKKHVRELAGYYLKRGKLRNYLLVVLGVYTALRISDLLRLTWADVYDFAAGRFCTHIELTERKTGKRKTIALNSKAVDALRLCLTGKNVQPGGFLFQSNKRKNAPIGRIQAWRIIKAAAFAVGLSTRVSCHSLRKTFGYHSWKAGVSPVVLMDIYNHSSYDVTRRYLGVAQEDLDTVYLGLVIL